jgi:hypothetical protein
MEPEQVLSIDDRHKRVARFSSSVYLIYFFILVVPDFQQKARPFVKIVHSQNGLD